MASLGIVESEEAFYRTLFEKWQEYLHRLKSGRKLVKAIGRDLESPEDVKACMEEIRIHLRGHNLYDIFYGPFKKEDFKDILDAVDEFAYFDSRKVRPVESA